VVTPWDTLLVSAPNQTSIWEVDAEGETTVWLSDIVSPNGMVFDDSGSNLYVAQTYETPNVFRRVEVSADHSAGAVHELAVLKDGSTQDGVAIDANGDVYVLLARSLSGELKP
jgi:sugar lactone lactonase YvrE